MTRDEHIMGAILALVIHVVPAVFVVTGWSFFASAASEPRSSRFQDAVTIEAALAFKAVEPPSKLPQKQKKETFKPPPEEGISRDADKKPEPKPEDKKMRPDPDEIDINATLDKFRRQDPDLSSTGVTELPREGAVDGSEWGTEREARGDPYVGELRGRIYDVWRVPTLETGSGTVVGCVRLDESGKIVDREVTKRSRNANLNRSVDVALKESTDMDKPVPAHLKNLLTQRGICFNFRLED
jgi:hypothetical protein